MLISLLKNVLPKRKVVYDSTFFGETWFSNWENLSEVLGNLISKVPQWKSILDFGCGPGVLIDQMNEKGFRYVGCDYSQEARALYLSHFGKNPNKYVAHLSELKMSDFDVLLSFDVFEHMRDEEIISLLKATQPIPSFFVNISRDLRTPGHINIKSDRGWTRFFKNQGFKFNESSTKLLREGYQSLRPGSPDKWQKNIFVFDRN